MILKIRFADKNDCKAVWLWQQDHMNNVFQKKSEFPRYHSHVNEPN